MHPARWLPGTGEFGDHKLITAGVRAGRWGSAQLGWNGGGLGPGGEECGPNGGSFVCMPCALGRSHLVALVSSLRESREVRGGGLGGARPAQRHLRHGTALRDAVVVAARSASGNLFAMSEPAEPQGPNPRDAHRALGLWPIRRALLASFSAAVLLLVGTWFFIVWLIGAPPKANPKPLDTAAQLELLKLAFATVAGVGALVALVTSYRRQRVDELAGERAERAQAHTVEVAKANIHDTTERRVTELYGRAVEQLGHEKATVRLGGLYSLERLAQHNEDHRPVVVEVICAYLRMPYTPPPVHGPSVTRDEPVAASDAQQELQVRKAAQKILARHLRKEPARARLQGLRREIKQNPLYWSEVSIDLHGACLVDIDFSECFFVSSVFDDATFFGQALFSGAIFEGFTRMSRARFKGCAAFDGVECGYLSLHESTFESFADFRNTAFRRQFSLSRVFFEDAVWFTGSRFHADVNIVQPSFPRGVNLSGARILNQDEMAELPTGWHVENDGDCRNIVHSGERPPTEAPRNTRPPYPRLDQDPSPQWG